MGSGKTFTVRAYLALVQSSIAILTEETAKRVVRHQNGSPTTIIAPPT